MLAAPPSFVLSPSCPVLSCPVLTSAAAAAAAASILLLLLLSLRSGPMRDASAVP